MSSKKKMRSKQTKRAAKKQLSTRHGIMLIALLAAMILVVNVVTLSYSWFAPAEKKGTGMSYRADAAVRSESCSIIHTNKGSLDENNENKRVYNTQTTSSETIPENSTVYFRTVINNTSPYPTNISLYITALPNPSETYGLGVAYPSNTYRKFPHLEEGSYADIYIVRNAYIPGAEDVNSPGELEIDWFIKTGSSPVTINPTASNLYIMYN